MDDVEIPIYVSRRGTQEAQNCSKRGLAPRRNMMKANSALALFANRVGKDVHFVLAIESSAEFSNVPAVPAALMIIVNDESDSHPCNLKERRLVSQQANRAGLALPRILFQARKDGS